MDGCADMFKMRTSNFGRGHIPAVWACIPSWLVCIHPSLMKNIPTLIDLLLTGIVIIAIIILLFCAISTYYINVVRNLVLVVFRVSAMYQRDSWIMSTMVHCIAQPPMRQSVVYAWILFFWMVVVYFLDVGIFITRNGMLYNPVLVIWKVI